MNENASAVKILIVCGHGINCEQEMFWAYKLLNVSKIDIIHINSIIENPEIIDKYDLIIKKGLRRVLSLVFRKNIKRK